MTDLTAASRHLFQPHQQPLPPNTPALLWGQGQQPAELCSDAQRRGEQQDWYSNIIPSKAGFEGEPGAELRCKFSSTQKLPFQDFLHNRNFTRLITFPTCSHITHHCGI